MTAWDFIELVRKMRKCQVAYFRTRLPGDLQSCKLAEQAVDKAIKEQDNPIINNPKLF